MEGRQDFKFPTTAVQNADCAGIVNEYFDGPAQHIYQRTQLLPYTVEALYHLHIDVQFELEILELGADFFHEVVILRSAPA